jgi:hypothetical protein
MTMTTTLKLPAGLRSHVSLFTSALATPLLGKWNEDQAFHDAEQPAAIGAALVKVLHTNLRHATIGYIFREKIETRGRIVLGKASRITGKLEYFSNLDLLIEINWLAWGALSDRQRIALIDHELLHFEMDVKDDGEKYVLAPHDLEEFNSIARRWGSWRPSIAHFQNALGQGQQIGLFTHD